VQILGASFDSVAQNKAFADKNRLPFPLLCDTNRVLGKLYGAGESGLASRITYIIDESGIITHTFPRVSPSTHAREVLALLQATAAGQQG
jgi:thioredoxin-dependent peroxiredoxin